MAIREGRWDCPSCGSVRIYGRHVDCPGCGKPRPAGVRFYLAAGAPAITDPEQLREAQAGADWICNHCAASNRALLAHCGGCGAPREDSPSQRVVQYGQNEIPRAGGKPLPLAAAPKAKEGNHRRASRNLLMGIAAICLLPIALVIGLTRGQAERTEIVPARVEALRWQRTISYYIVGTSADSGWTVPPDAEVTAQERRLVRTERRLARVDTTWADVPTFRSELAGVDTVRRTVSDEVRVGTTTRVCGTKDLGNGYFEDVECSEPVYETRTRTETRYEPRYRSVPAGTERRMSRNRVYANVPVYATWYTFQRREQSTFWVTSSGPADSARTWPALPSDTLREASRSETYWMNVRDARGSEHRVELRADSLFARFSPGQRIALRLREYYRDQDDVLPLDSLPACRRWHAGKGDPPPASLGCSPRRR
ncbi:Ran-binding zinc finger domain-containing protein [Longimicrobium sp.]|uniref:zinc finger Ran-binding domain-containing protein n=1 Tax=Longimicrobium sp. TaxID=2029185 RepID=UPI002E36D262|nr:Ran-binding zinc finger domain-containing protein [Longimicrobium sp.]HEX6041078.1 Ran-binding zinc finger domain-containing protein [Longimicrobium sp.]